MVSKLCTFLIMYFVFRYADGASDNSSNVAFVIDDTASMTLVINQVINKAKEMFNVIYGSKTSVIGDFILITFNDVETFNNDTSGNDFSFEAVKLRKKTRDSDEFLTALQQISAVGGGFGAKELSFRGIYMAIEKCNPDSYIYVFTDEGPRDYHLKNTIKHLAQQKSIQINFLLTVENLLNDTMYKSIADATSGEIFPINRDDVEKILNYVMLRLRGPSTTLITVPNQPGESNFSVTADNDMKNLSFITKNDVGSNVELDITGPDGKRAPTNKIIDIPNTKCLIVENPENGSYVAKVKSNGSGETSVKAEVSVDFKLGFSTWNASSIKNTKVNPVPDVESYLVVQLILTGTTDAKVNNITILDMDGKELTTLSANVINETDKLYISPLFKPPDLPFKIGIAATDIETGATLKRVYRSAIEPQPRITDQIPNKRPEVTIENSPKIDAIYGGSLKLECIVNGYPQPSVVWEDEETGLVLPSTVSIMDLPYDYMSLLEINKITKDGSYKCKATSSQNETVTASIKVETFREKYLNILESPKDTKIDYEKSDKLQCKIDAWPPALVQWYKNDKELTNHGDFEISNDNVTLLIKKMRPELEGPYSCRATTEDFSRTANFTLTLSGVGIPEIDHSKSIETVTGGTKATIACRITKGVPEPNINWSFKKDGTKDFVSMLDMGQEIQIDSVNIDNAGTYRCVAKNIKGEDSHETKLIVQSAPVIEKSEKAKTVNIGTDAVLVCRILEGIPKPTITWEFKSQTAIQFITLPETGPEVNISPVKIDSSGIYKCYAKNEVGEDFHEIVLSVNRIPTVVANQSVSAKIGDEVTLPCEAFGEPTPDVKWIKDGKTITTDKKYEIFSNHSLKFVADFDNEGNYTCVAKNDLGEDSKSTLVLIDGAVKIEPPEKSFLSVDVATYVELVCNASGSPEPLISWTFISSNPNNELQVTDLGHNDASHVITRIQLKDAGKYKCIAKNDFDEKELTYEVLVTAPVKIDSSLQKEFTIVKNDHVLKIPCKVKGVPKPKVYWMKYFNVLKMGDSYTQDSDGALIINNPDKSFEAKYICVASNGIMHDLKLFTVNFRSTPTSNEPTETIYLKEFTSTELECKLPHNSTDTVRWYTRGSLIQATNKFILNHAQVFDSGIYICRVSSSEGTQTANYQVIVGSEPIFETRKNSEIIVPFVHGRNADLDCNVKGSPTPTVTWWQNGIKIENARPLYHISELNETHLGEFRCEAKNEFGNTSRTYIMKVTGCTIDYLEKEPNKFHPILISDSGYFAEYPNEEGKMIVSENDDISFVCPDNVRKLFCSENKFIFVDNTSLHVTYDDLKCSNEVEPSVRQYSNPDDQCAKVDDSKRIQVGYEYKGSFYGVYDVCIDRNAPRIYYTKHDVTQYASDIQIDSHPFIAQYLNFSYDEMFDCSKQKDILKEGCCFLGKQLVTPQDVSPCLQKSTYFNMITSPQLNYCGHNLNFNEVEKRIRALAKSLKSYKLEVMSGEHDGQFSFVLNDDNGNQKLVPNYLWKVVQIREIDEALAIITINIPNLTEEVANELRFCKDVCDITEWMKNPEWHNVLSGYTFCCNAWDFADIVNPYYKNIFQSNLLYGNEE